MKRLSGLVFGALALSCVSYGQTAFIGRDRYPQYRDISGLPGGGFGVNREGYVSFLGAYALTTPLGISMRSGENVFGFATRSDNLTLTSPGVSSDTGANSAGSAQFIFGISTGIGDITIAHFVMSSRLDNTQNIQFSPKIKSDSWNFSIGVQNYRGRGQRSGEMVAGDEEFSRSVYVAATCEYKQGNYFTIGKGDHRYQGLFANHTYSFDERFKHMIEWDRFGFNQMLYYACPVPFLVNKGQQGKMFVGVGAVGGAAGVWSLNFSF